MLFPKTLAPAYWFNNRPTGWEFAFKEKVMFKTVKKEVQKIEGEGLLALLGERVLIMCGCYFYEGLLEGVNEKCVLLSDAHIVYETGAWSESGYSDRQRVADEWYVQIESIESFGKSSC